jgi:hypothetical protein
MIWGENQGYMSQKPNKDRVLGKIICELCEMLLVGKQDENQEIDSCFDLTIWRA